MHLTPVLAAARAEQFSHSVSPKHPHKNVGTLGTVVAEKPLNGEKHASVRLESITRCRRKKTKGVLNKFLDKLRRKAPAQPCHKALTHSSLQHLRGRLDSSNII